MRRLLYVWLRSRCWQRTPLSEVISLCIQGTLHPRPSPLLRRCHCPASGYVQVLRSTVAHEPLPYCRVCSNRTPITWASTSSASSQRSVAHEPPSSWAKSCTVQRRGSTSPTVFALWKESLVHSAGRSNSLQMRTAINDPAMSKVTTNLSTTASSWTESKVSDCTSTKSTGREVATTEMLKRHLFRGLSFGPT